jgi:hypothetical protein
MALLSSNTSKFQNGTKKKLGCVTGPTPKVMNLLWNRAATPRRKLLNSSIERAWQVFSIELFKSFRRGVAAPVIL